MNIELPLTLDSDLRLRSATPADAEALGDFNSRVHSDDGWDKPFPPLGVWTRDLLTRPHPTMTAADFTLVEEINTGRVVSTLNLINQTWTYAGIPFGVGRPELVGTHPDYRNRGLVRKQFDVVHQWSAERGQMVQAITGIPYYYRQFGYEMCVTLGGGRMAYGPQIPKLKEGEAEPYRLRPAHLNEWVWIDELYRASTARDLLACVRDESIWQYELSGRSEDSLVKRVMLIIETPQGEPVGALTHSPRLWAWAEHGLGLNFYELKPGVSYAAVTPSVLRYLWSVGQDYAARDPQACESLFFSLRLDHPMFQALPQTFPRTRKPYAWYLRVPDVAAFLNHIAPVLEQRLAVSPVAGHTGTLKLSNYRTGLRLNFESGRITAEPYDLDGKWEGDAQFPNHSFLSVLFGWRSAEEHTAIFPDGYQNSATATALLNALFPKQDSYIWPIE